MITKDGDIIKFAVDEIDGEPGSLLLPTYEEAELLLEEEQRRHPDRRFTINEVVTYEKVKGVRSA